MKEWTWHYQPNGAWQLTEAEYCGTRSMYGLQTTQKLEFVTCRKCIKKLNKENYNK